jgi:bifunctional non-homologous end joining protein LigD
MLVRYPDGIAGKSFYQWNVPHGMPAWVKSITLGKHVSSAEGDDHKKHVFLIDRRESLLYIANLACIPIHVLASRIDSPNVADYLVIDFDVNRSSLRVAIDLAHTLREILEAVGLRGFPKTSGQTGLHVFVPLGAGVTPTAARTFADLLGRLVVDRHPSVATMERVVNKRGPKVYVDTGQTGPSRTIVAPYSVRATKGGRVSTPLAWDEIVPDLDPGAFTIKTVVERLSRIEDPMRMLLVERPDPDEVLSKLGALVGRAS